MAKLIGRCKHNGKRYEIGDEAPKGVTPDTHPHLFAKPDAEPEPTPEPAPAEEPEPAPEPSEKPKKGKE